MTINELKEKVLNGYQITKKDDLSIFKNCNLEELCNAANEIRKKFSGNKAELCSIINGKSGHCSENSLQTVEKKPSYPASTEQLPAICSQPPEQQLKVMWNCLTS